VVIPKSNDMTGHWHAAPAVAWKRDSKWRKFPGGGMPARSRQLGHHRSQLVSRRLR
jgi:hypothetical protein